MPSTYTTDLAIQLMATGENAGTWGQITNTNLVVVQQAIAGYESISIAGGAQTTALLMTQNALSTARNAVIKLTGTITGNQIVTVPNGIEKTWIVSNGTTGAFTVQFKYASTGTGQTWSTTDKGIKILYSDGSDIQVVDLSTLSGTVATAQIANLAVTTAKLDTGAVTAVKITQSTITQAKLASSSVGGTQIIQSTITQSKLAANSVGSNQLISTGVTASTYTNATVTVDADGRITSASSGAAGGIPATLPRLAVSGPASGTFTAEAAANRLGVYMYAGGGAGGGPGPMTVGSGGSGGFGFYDKPITQPFSQPYSVGAGGNPGGYGNGNSGGATNVTNVGTVNGGAAASGTSPGANGNQPGSTSNWNLRSFITGFGAGSGGGGAFNNPMCGPSNPAQGGQSGALIIFDNTGA